MGAQRGCGSEKSCIVLILLHAKAVGPRNAFVEKPILEGP